MPLVPAGHPHLTSERSATMKYRTLPGTGISVSNLALGTMGFGTETDQADAFAILDRFVESDGTWSTRPTSTAVGRPRNCSAAGSPAAPPTPPGVSSWLPRSGSEQGPTPTRTARRAETSTGR